LLKSVAHEPHNRMAAGRRTAANLLTRNEARRIAANIARLPELLNAEQRPAANAFVHRRLT
jgi:hypothetical protein